MSGSNDKVFLFIGSSAAKMFKLIYGSQARVFPFPTATAKGLGQNNSNSQSILHIISSKYANVDISAIIWLFGNVDVKFSYYYKLCREWEGPGSEIPDPLLLMEECANKYIEFVKKVHDTLVVVKDPNTKTVVLGAEPNGAPPNIMFDQCVKYFVTPDTDVNRVKITHSISLTHPDLLRIRYNQKLQELCKKFGFDYIDLDDSILIPVQDLNQHPRDISLVNPEYVDLNPTSVHLNWEGNVKLYIEKLSKIGIVIEDTLDLESTRNEYLEEKKNRKRKSSEIIEARWKRSLTTHIDEREATGVRRP
jgi:hypothetical protein